MTDITETSKLSLTLKTWGLGVAFLLATGIPGLIAFDGYYAHASDVLVNKHQLQIVKMTFEQSQNEMRLDIIDGRIDRELDKVPEKRDTRKVEKLRKQYNRLETRQLMLDTEQMKRDNIRL